MLFLETMNHKGQTEQFNWIFVLVAGAIILGFFSLFIFKYVELQQKRFNIGISQDLSNAFQVLSTSSVGSSSTIDSSEGFKIGSTALLDFSCTDDQLLLRVNEDPDAVYRFRDEFVFSRSSLRVDSLDLWLKPWFFPFYVGNFVFLSDPDDVFYFVYDASTREEVLSLDIPSIFTVKTVSINDALPERSSLRVVYFTSSLPRSDLDRFSSVSHISLSEKNVRFYEEGRWSDEISFPSDAFVYGAVFSDSSSLFSCLVQKSEERISFLSKVYAQKAHLLSFFDRRPECSYDLLFQRLVSFGKGDYDLLSSLEGENSACMLVF